MALNIWLDFGNSTRGIEYEFGRSCLSTWLGVRALRDKFQEWSLVFAAIFAGASHSAEGAVRVR